MSNQELELQVFSILERPGLILENQADAAQLAEMLHTEHGVPFHVLCNGELCYTSKGPID